MSCQFDCLAKFKCEDISKPIDGAIYAPFAEVTFQDGGTKLTVGNESNEPDNHAVLKSFEYGLSSGQGLVLEIYDEQGSELKYSCKN